MDEGDVGMTAQSTPASVRRELWRDTQQQSVGSIDEADTGADPEYMGASRSPHSSFSSPQVSVDSPRISFSPLHIKDSIEEEEGELQYEPVTIRSQSLTVPGYCTPPTLSLHSCHADHRDHHCDPGARSPRGRAGHRSQLRWHSPGHNTLLPNPAQYSPRARSVSPISVSGRSPVPGNYFGHYEQFFRQRLTEGDTGGRVKGVGRQDQEQDIYRRWMSDTDISSDCIENVSTSVNISNSQDIPDAASDNVFYNQTARYPKTSSVESDQSSVQEFPLDLSMRSSMSSTSTSESISGKFLFPSRRHPMLSSSSHSYRSLSSESSSKSQGPMSVETSPSPNTSLDSSSQWLCPLCNQGFSVHDRLAKHMASRHREKVCKRTFARSDMLTRHMRLHTGYKPYSCRTCGQVFSRSDHLSTHQRTHTGEKPYKCPSYGCSYSACRRDMITRHLRTHNRYETQESSSIDEATSTLALTASNLRATRSVSSESENLSKDSSDHKLMSEYLAPSHSFEGQHLQEAADPRLSRDFSESRLSQDFSENRISFDLSEQRFFGDKNDSSFTDQSSKDFEVHIALSPPLFFKSNIQEIQHQVETRLSRDISSPADGQPDT